MEEGILLISVLIVDDHPIVLKGTKAMFQGIEDLYIETEIDPEQVYIRMQNEYFHIYLLDINMSKKNGIELASEIKAMQENAIIILYTGDDIGSYYSLIIEKKIDGILSKTAPIERVINTIRSATQGGIVLPIGFIDYINKKMQNKYETLKLTNKETELIKMVMDGYTNKQMAETLYVTQRTVERYLAQIYNILGVSSRREVIEFIKEKGLI